jgi:hypothetical protein
VNVALTMSVTVETLGHARYMPSAMTKMFKIALPDG